MSSVLDREVDRSRLRMSTGAAVSIGVFLMLVIIIVQALVGLYLVDRLQTIEDNQGLIKKNGRLSACRQDALAEALATYGLVMRGRAAPAQLDVMIDRIGNLDAICR